MHAPTLALLVLSTVVLSCAAPALPSNQQGGAGDRRPIVKRITAGLRGDPFTLNDRINTAGAGSIRAVDRLEKLLNTGLAIEDDEGVLQARLAEAVPSAENGLWRVLPDGRMVTTWHLRPGAQWHDGAPFTAEDVLFTAQVAQDRDLPFSRHASFDLIESVVAPDPQTVTVTWKSPFIEADRMFSSHSIVLPMPKHLLERPYQKEKESFTELSFWTEHYIGTGPFKLRTWVRSSHMIIDANPHYILGRPKVNEIEIRFIPDPDTLAANVLAGEIDLTLAGLSVDQAFQVRDQWKEGTVTPSASTTTWIALWPQFLDPSPRAVGEVQFRRALLHGMDRQEMTDVFNYGLSPVAHSPVHPERPEYRYVQSSVAHYDFDVRRAIQLIEQLGYTKNSEGFFGAPDAPAGSRLTLEVRSTATDDAQLKPAFAIADFWQRLGIATEPVPVPRQRAVDRAYRSTFPGFEVVRQSADYRRFGDFRSSQTPLPENNFTGKNRNRYRNAEYDLLLDRLLVTIPLEERMRMLSAIVQHITDNVLIMGLFYNVGATMVANRLRGVRSSEVSAAHVWDVAS